MAVCSPGWMAHALRCLHGKKEVHMVGPRDGGIRWSDEAGTPFDTGVNWAWRGALRKSAGHNGKVVGRQSFRLTDAAIQW
jgi:hypothetical protein